MARKLPQHTMNETKRLAIKLIEQLEKEATRGYRWEYKDWKIEVKKRD